MSTRKRTSAKLALVEFVRPDAYWPSPYSLEQAFELLRWMLATGQDYKFPTRWVDQGVHWLLGTQTGCIHIRHLDDLKHGLHRGILGRDSNDTQRRWRADHDIRVGGEVDLAFRHNKPMTGAPHTGLHCERDVRIALERFLGTPAGTRMRAQLNSCNRTAKVIHHTEIGVSPNKFYFTVKYGCNAFQAGQVDSEWTHELASTQSGETFLDTFARARSELEKAITEDFIVNLDGTIAA